MTGAGSDKASREADPQKAATTTVESVEDSQEPTDEAGNADLATAGRGLGARERKKRWAPIAAFWMLPTLALVLALVTAFLKWQEAVMHESAAARAESIEAAKGTVVALLSYKPETVDKDLAAAAPRLTGSFRRQYEDLINKVVIPGSHQQHISTVATVPAASAVSASGDRAVLLLYVDQTTTVGDKPPTDLQSTVRVTMNKVNDRWMMSEFDPV
ncbi:hypothetical protein A5706_09820 [Mycobacterium sp. E796]|nr:hypothetical protein A5706_09820 [Mycobacterium sp. E796]